MSAAKAISCRLPSSGNWRKRHKVRRKSVRRHEHRAMGASDYALARVYDAVAFSKSHSGRTNARTSATSIDEPTMTPSANPHFLPWEGTAYRSLGLGGRRLLILGESHYDWGAGRDRPTLTQEIVEDYAASKTNHQFFNRVTRICEGEVSGVGRRLFWDRVAYYIFVQVMLKKGTRPTRSDWALSGPIFESTLQNLAPDYLLVLGKELWDSMPSPSGTVDLQVGSSLQAGRWYATGERAALATFINHPRSRGFVVDRWSQVVRTLLEHPRASS